MNSEERSIYIKYAYNKTFKYIWSVYAEFEIRVNYSPEEYEGIKTGECRFDYDSWETRLNISHKQMVRAIKELTQNDKVLIQKVKGTKGNSSIYFLTRFEEVLKIFEEQKKEQNEEQNEEQKELHNSAVLEGEEERNKEQNEEQKKVHTSKYNNLSIKSNIESNCSEKKKTKKNKVIKTAKELIEEYTDNEKLKNAIYNFMDYRESKKKSMSPQAITLLLNKLNESGDNVNKKIAMIEQSIMNSWTGIFPLKESNVVPMRKTVGLEYDDEEFIQY